MNPARWQQIKSVFGDVLQLEPAQRSAYIEAIGATDPDLREQLALLLLWHDKDSGEFLGSPAVDLKIYRDLIDIDTDTWLGKHIGPYRPVQELGSGSMGEADRKWYGRLPLLTRRCGRGCVEDEADPPAPMASKCLRWKI
jgi:hypothetical protein